MIPKVVQIASKSLGIKLFVKKEISHQHNSVVLQVSDQKNFLYALKYTDKNYQNWNSSYNISKLIRNEAKIISKHGEKLKIGLIGSGNSNGIDWILTKWIDGKNPLSYGKGLVKKDFNEKKIKKKIGMLFLSMAQALQRIHNVGIIHGDIQHRNYIYNKENNTSTIIDFALSHEFHKEGFTYKGCLAYFLAPEIARGIRENGQAIPTYQSDIFSLGVCFYHIIQGEYPFDYPETSSVDEILQINSEKSPRELTDMVLYKDEELENIIFDCLENTQSRANLQEVITKILARM